MPRKTTRRMAAPRPHHAVVRGGRPPARAVYIAPLAPQPQRETAGYAATAALHHGNQSVTRDRRQAVLDGQPWVEVSERVDPSFARPLPPPPPPLSAAVAAGVGGSAGSSAARDQDDDLYESVTAEGKTDTAVARGDDQVQVAAEQVSRLKALVRTGIARMSQGRPARLRLLQSYWVEVANSGVGTRLLTYVTTQAGVYNDWVAISAMFEAWRCIKVTITYQVTHTSNVTHGTMVAVSPDVDNNAAPSNFDVALSRVNEVKVVPTDACSGHHAKHTYTYHVPQHNPYDEFLDIASSGHFGCIQIASMNTGPAANDIAIKAFVCGEFEYVNRE